CAVELHAFVATCVRVIIYSFCFFFQAEDGIRDHCVTGVQTCALPISPPGAPLGAPDDRDVHRASPAGEERAPGTGDSDDRWPFVAPPGPGGPPPRAFLDRRKGSRRLKKPGPSAPRVPWPLRPPGPVHRGSPPLPSGRRRNEDSPDSARRPPSKA